MICLSSCVKTVTQTEVKYIPLDIPEAIISPCDPIPTNTSISTNGELLTAYVSLQASYAICSSKVSSISMILKSYNNIYSISSVEVNE